MIVHQNRPEGFNPQVEVAACYLEVNGHFLLIQYTQGRKEGGLWGLPAGKLEKNETPEDALRRELFEETGLLLEPHTPLLPYAPLFFRKPDIDFLFHMFKVNRGMRPEIRLSKEHQNYCWATLHDLEQLPMVSGSKEAILHLHVNLSQ
jgi:8-oxo-dGTP pyrophosphatase MutT (NUDIX family)